MMERKIRVKLLPWRMIEWKVRVKKMPLGSGCKED
jgi:hypothetical protein